MTDVILSVRLDIDDNPKNKELIAKFAKWLNQNYSEHAQSFIHDILNSAQIPFDGYITTEPSHTLDDDVFIDFRHPKKAKGRIWFLDDLEMKNNHPVWIRLENQWLKGRIAITSKEQNIVVEPEGVVIPITEKLFLKW